MAVISVSIVIALAYFVVFTSLQHNGNTEAIFCDAQLADMVVSYNRLEAQWITKIRCQQHLRVNDGECSSL